MRRLLLPLAALLIGMPALAVEPVPPPAPPAGPVVLLTDHALDGAGGTLKGARIEVAGGKIRSLAAAEGKGTVIDLRGYTVLPGWIDVHVHLDSHFDAKGRIATSTEPPADWAMGVAGAAWDSLMGGFTTVQSVGDYSELPLRNAIRDHGFPGPRVLTSLTWIEGDAKMNVRSLPVQLGVGNAAVLASFVMALPQVLVIALLARNGKDGHALAVVGLLVAQVLLMVRMVAAPRERAAWYNATGTTLYVSGMMVSAFAVRGLLTAAG